MTISKNDNHKIPPLKIFKNIIFKSITEKINRSPFPFVGDLSLWI